MARQLSKSKIPTSAIHSNRSQNQRARALQDFKDGKTRVLVATDIAARGIDVEGITHVINFDFPPNTEDYIHRIGRTGRANTQGEAISFITPEDHGPLRLLERKIRKTIYRKKVSGFNLSRSPSAGKFIPYKSKESGRSSSKPKKMGRDSKMKSGNPRRRSGQRRSSGR